MKRILVYIVLIAFGAVAYKKVFMGENPHHPKPLQQTWSTDGVFGTYDTAALQRGFQVYDQVCAACHSLNQLYYRNLTQIGFTPDQVKAIAARVDVTDGPNDAGEMFERKGKPSDHFHNPFANEQQARAANNGAFPPDLSLITKARNDGKNYVYSLIAKGYEPAPSDFKVLEGLHYNKYFPSKQIGMIPPLTNGQVEYEDKTPATVEQMTHDVVEFLSWAADPHLVERKRMGFKVIIFLLILTGFLYGAKRKIWKDLH